MMMVMLVTVSATAKRLAIAYAHGRGHWIPSSNLVHMPVAVYRQSTLDTEPRFSLSFNSRRAH